MIVKVRCGMTHLDKKMHGAQKILMLFFLFIMLFEIGTDYALAIPDFTGDPKLSEKKQQCTYGYTKSAYDWPLKWYPIGQPTTGAVEATCTDACQEDGRLTSGVRVTDPSLELARGGAALFKNPLLSNKKGVWYYTDSTDTLISPNTPTIGCCCNENWARNPIPPTPPATGSPPGGPPPSPNPPAPTTPYGITPLQTQKEFHEECIRCGGIPTTSDFCITTSDGSIKDAIICPYVDLITPSNPYYIVGTAATLNNRKGRGEICCSPYPYPPGTTTLSCDLSGTKILDGITDKPIPTTTRSTIFSTRNLSDAICNQPPPPPGGLPCSSPSLGSPSPPTPPSPSSPSQSQLYKLQVPVPTIGVDLTLCTGSGDNLTCDGIARYLTIIFEWLIRFAIVAGVLTLTLAGYFWMTARGDSQQTDKAITMVKNTLWGIVLALGSYTLLWAVNPDLVNFKALNLKKIKEITITLDPCSFTENSGTDIPPGDPSQSFPPGKGTNNVPLYKQGRAGPYGATPFGQCGTISSSGCGPTSTAMLLTYYLKRSIEPPEVANLFAQEGFRGCSPGCTTAPCRCCGGPPHTAIISPRTIGKYGLKGEFVRPLTPNNIIDNYLKQNKPLIVTESANDGACPNKFTSAGHYIVLTGYDAASGNILINDPAKNNTNGTPAEVFTCMTDAMYIHP